MPDMFINGDEKHHLTKRTVKRVGKQSEIPITESESI